MKIYTKSLTNATEQQDEVIQASLNACIKFKCPLIVPMFKPYFVMKMNNH